MHKFYVYQTGSLDGLDGFSGNNCILIRLELGEFFRREPVDFCIVFADYRQTRISRFRRSGFLRSGENSPKRSKDAALRLATEKRRIVLQIKSKDDLTRQLWILQ